MDLKVYILESDLIDSRHKDRNDNQSEKFIKGRRTKVKNIKEYLKENFTVLKNNTENDLNKNYKVLCNNLMGG